MVPGSRRSSRIVLPVLVVLFTSAAPVAALVDVRWAPTIQRWQGDLTRAYLPCLAPNDASSEGVPACTPPVTSICTFDHGDVAFRPRTSAPLVTVSANLEDVGGPGACTTGPYALAVVLRITADDPACAGGLCTFEDQTYTVPLDPRPSSDFEARNVVLDDLIPGDLVNESFAVVSATVIAPDGLPIASTGLVGNDATDVTVAMTAGHPPCTAPDTTGVLGDACSAPVWPSACDYEGALLRWTYNDNRATLLFRPNVQGLVGVAPQCAAGTLESLVVVRVTDDDCTGGAPCTLVDQVVTTPLTLSRGSLSDTVPFPDDLGVVLPATSVEMRQAALVDANGDLLAEAGFGHTGRLADPKVTIAKRDLADPNDDTLKVQATFANAGIDPTDAAGFSLTIGDRLGPIYAVTIPGNLWQLGQPLGTKWTYTNEFGTIGGVRKAQIKAFKSDGQIAGFKVKLQAKDVNLSAAGYPAVNLTMDIANDGTFGSTFAQRNRVCRATTKTLNCR